MAAVFKLKPGPIPDGFKWRSDKYHFTYSGFLEPEEVLGKIRSATSTPIVGWSTRVGGHQLY